MFNKKGEPAKYDLFIYNEMNEICVGLVENNYSCIQSNNAFMSTGNLLDVMPLFLHSIEQLNKLVYNKHF